MEIKRDRMVFLGYGKYWRSDVIVGLMPIEDERGPGRRTNVFVEGRAEPIVASRTEQSILEDMGATDEGFQIQALRESVRELLAAFLVFYMVAPINGGGLGFGVKHATSIYGTYTAGVWAAAIVGGIVADQWLGHYRSVLVGGIIIALGHFSLALHALPFFYLGLSLIVVGTGLLKPNVSSIVGSLYAAHDARRDAGFSIFYMGINLGAAIGPLIAGYLAQKVDWHLGFACAGVGMTLGLVQYVVGRRRLEPGILRLQARSAADAPAAGDRPSLEGGALGFSRAEWKRIAAMCVFFLAAVVFWAGYEQAGSTLSLFADRYTRLSAFGLSFPSSWFASVQAIFVILLAPVFA